ncbi:MAG: DNA-methyltransferase [Thermoplasmata archaeon]
MSNRLSPELPIEKTVRKRQLLYDRDYREGYDITLVCNDVLEGLSSISDGTASLVLSSPPYNLGKPYEHVRDFQAYLEWQQEVIAECVRVLNTNGSICWQVGNYVEDGEIFPLDIYLYHRFKQCDLKLRNRIIWHFGHGLHAKKRFSGRHETILWFTKGDEYTFNLDEVRVPQKYPGKRGYKGPRKGEPTANPNGKNPSDVWEILCRDWERGIWRIPNVKANHVEKTIHPSQFPIELAERIVLALTEEGDVVLDPFVGVGSSLIAAALHRRRSIGIDREKLYTDIAFRRTLLALQGRLRRRPLGKEVFLPKGTEKVARTPPEWSKGSKDKASSRNSFK